MKKIYAIFVTVILIFILAGCENSKFELSGSYFDGNTRYEFIITDAGRGDYGGSCNVY